MLFGYQTFYHSKSKQTRGVTMGKLRANGTPKTCIADATRLRNQAPDNIRNAKTISMVKRETKIFCMTLPI